jgi:hypothetical protein
MGVAKDTSPCGSGPRRARRHVACGGRAEGEVGPGEAYVIEPGHAWVIGDERVVAFEFESHSAEEYAKAKADPRARDAACQALHPLPWRPGAQLTMINAPIAHEYAHGDGHP